MNIENQIQNDLDQLVKSRYGDKFYSSIVDENRFVFFDKNGLPFILFEVSLTTQGIEVRELDYSKKLVQGV